MDAGVVTSGHPPVLIAGDRLPPESDPAHPASSSVSSVDPAPAGEAPALPLERRISPPPPEELERVRARDGAALAMFYERYFDHVYSLATRLMGERERAEDVTQDVFLKVWRAAPGLDVQRDPAPWLTAITCNACRDVWRSGAYRAARSGTPVADDPELGVVLSSGRNDPEEDALAAERVWLVQRALARLPEALRVPVVLHDYQGMGHAEIARLLGIDHAAARKRYSRALSALAGELAALEGGAG